jgi:hypothetical protein
LLECIDKEKQLRDIKIICLVLIDLHHVYVLLLFRVASTGKLKEKEDEDA